MTREISSTLPLRLPKTNRIESFTTAVARFCFIGFFRKIAQQFYRKEDRWTPPFFSSPLLGSILSVLGPFGEIPHTRHFPLRLSPRLDTDFTIFHKCTVLTYIHLMAGSYSRTKIQVSCDLTPLILGPVTEIQKASEPQSLQQQI